MLNKLTAKSKLSVPLLALLAAVGFSLLPSDAFAAGFSCMDGNMGLFRTIACKVTTTLYDIRKIVYIIGGFGLIAFTYAAIFNKISFKHLANICISLFLLSMMTPFIEYFVSDDGYTLTFHDKLPTDFTEADWSQTEDCGSNCPKSVNETSSGGLAAGANGSGISSSVGGSSAAGTAGTVGAAGAAESPMARGGALEKLEGIGTGTGVSSQKNSGLALAKEPIDNRTGWQKLKDGVNKTVGVVRDAKNAADAGLATYAAVTAAGRNIYDTAKNTNYKDPNAIFNAIRDVGNSVNSGLGAITSGAGTVGDIYFDKEGEKTTGRKTEEAFKPVVDTVNDINEMTGNVGEGYNHINNARDYGNQIRRPWQ